MPEARPNDIPHNVLQDYLESLAETGGHPEKRLEKILASYAELRYRINGGGHCAMCRAAVRHVLPVRVEHTDGSTADYQCLCTRCMQAERALSDRVTLTVGKASLVYTAGQTRPRTTRFKAINR